MGLCVCVCVVCWPACLRLVPAFIHAPNPPAGPFAPLSCRYPYRYPYRMRCMFSHHPVCITERVLVMSLRAGVCVCACNGHVGVCVLGNWCRLCALHFSLSSEFALKIIFNYRSGCLALSAHCFSFWCCCCLALRVVAPFVVVVVVAAVRVVVSVAVIVTGVLHRKALAALSPTPLLPHRSAQRKKARGRETWGREDGKKCRVYIQKKGRKTAGNFTFSPKFRLLLHVAYFRARNGIQLRRTAREMLWRGKPGECAPN